MKTTTELILNTLKPMNPKSVFLYGSQARGDATSKSDYEVGVIFDDDKYVSRREVHSQVQIPNVRVYPFKVTELQKGTFDTPFQRTIYLRELVEGGETIEGEEVIEKLTPPLITTLDLIQRIRFDIGYSLAAVLSNRSGDTKTTLEEFCKSCLFGLRCLEILELKTFPVCYKAIYEASGKVVGEPEYKAVVEAAYGLRKGENKVTDDIIFSNISFLNKFVEKKIMVSFNVDGNQVLV